MPETKELALYFGNITGLTRGLCFGILALMSHKLHLGTSKLESPYTKEEKERNEKIVSLYETGSYSHSSLARIFKISKQRIAQIIKKTLTSRPKTNENLVNEIDPRNTPDQW